MRKTVPMQPADVAAWTEIARIAEEKLEEVYEGPRNPYIDDPELLHARMGVLRMKKPDINDWMEWANKTRTIGAALPAFAEAAFLMHERMHAMYAYLCTEVPDECRVVSLMQNEGE